MGYVAPSYFLQLYLDNVNRGCAELQESFFRHLLHAITNQDNALLLLQVIGEDVKAALFVMGAYKVLGPDGFSPVFFQEFLNIVRYDVTCIARDFIRTDNLLKTLNDTYIVLVPKTQDPRGTIDFRPISWCNTIYKIFTNVMMNRVKPLLDKIISPNYNGFVQGKQILDATLTTHEIIHSLDNCKELGMAFKLDISKVYN